MGSDETGVLTNHRNSSYLKEIECPDKETFFRIGKRGAVDFWFL
jgi:hypothetical protein